jgi:hypothetical protein
MSPAAGLRRRVGGQGIDHPIPAAVRGSSSVCDVRARYRRAVILAPTVPFKSFRKCVERMVGRFDTSAGWGPPSANSTVARAAYRLSLTTAAALEER